MSFDWPLLLFYTSLFISMMRRVLIHCPRCITRSNPVVRTSKRAAPLRALLCLDASPPLSSLHRQQQYKFHSSFSTTSQESTTTTTTIYQSPNVSISKQSFTERLLHDIPIGSMQDEDWQHAYPTFLWWTQQEASSETVTTAWQLLDRLVQEQHTVGYAQVPLEPHLLNRLLEVSRVVTVVNNGTHELVVSPKEWLQRLDTYSPYLTPNTATYSMIMGALTKWSDEPEIVPDLVESLLRRMQEESLDNASLEPDTAVYNSVLYAWANSGLDEAPHRAQALLEEMIAHDELLMQPNEISYGTLVTTWSRSRDPNAATRAQDILRDMQQLETVSPNTIVYNAVLQAWERSGRHDSAHCADVLFREMLHLTENGNELVRPDDVTFRIIIRTLVYGNEVARADDVIRLQLEWYQDGDLLVAPARKHFDSILHEWVKAPNPNAAERAESLLRLMNDLYEQQQGHDELKPTYRNFRTVIAAWVKSNNYNAAKHAQVILEWMLQFAQDNNDSDMVPTTLMCTSIINAWCKNRDESSPEHAQAMLEKMKAWYEAGNDAVQPNLITYNTLMKVWSKSRRPDAPERVEAIMRSMVAEEGIHADRVSYNQLMNTYANSNDPDAPEKAENVLRHLSQRHANGDSEMKPNLVSFNTVMKTWANSTTDGAAERAEAFLRYMQEVSQETNSQDLQPNAVCYTMAIRAWINSSDKDVTNAATRAAFLLEEVHDLHRAGHDDLKLKKQVYFDIMQLLAKSRRSITAGQVAERILLHMQHLAEEGDEHMSPTTKFFNFSIRAWSISGHQLAAQRAESILNFMQELRTTKGADLEPNRLTYNFVIRAWGKSGDVFAGKRAEQHLQRMLKLSEAGRDQFTPDSYTYRDLAIAWKNSGHADAEIKSRKYAKISSELRAKAEAQESK